MLGIKEEISKFGEMQIGPKKQKKKIKIFFGIEKLMTRLKDSD